MKNMGVYELLKTKEREREGDFKMVVKTGEFVLFIDQATTGDSVVYHTYTADTVFIDVTGDFTGTVMKVLGSMVNGLNYLPLYFVINDSTGEIVSEITEEGRYIVEASSVESIKLTIESIESGSVTAILRAISS